MTATKSVGDGFNELIVNGDVAGVTVSAGSTAAVCTGGFRLGDVAVDDHDIHEIIAYDRKLSTAEIEEIEGYLACKWNLRDLLPATHLYYDAVGTNKLNCNYQF